MVTGFNHKSILPVNYFHHLQGVSSMQCSWETIFPPNNLKLYSSVPWINMINNTEGIHNYNLSGRLLFTMWAQLIRTWISQWEVISMAAKIFSAKSKKINFNATTQESRLLLQTRNRKNTMEIPHILHPSLDVCNAGRWKEGNTPVFTSCSVALICK